MEIAPKESHIVYFYTTPCDDCAKTQALLSELPARITAEQNGESIESPVTVEYISINTDEGLQEIYSFFSAYNVPSDLQKTPIIFLTGEYFSGYDAIEMGLRQALEGGDALDFAYPETEAVPLVAGDLELRDFPLIFVMGLVNGLNPCSISILLLLLSLLTAQKDKILPIGFSFLGGRMIGYLLFGTVLYSVLSYIDSRTMASVQNAVNILLIVVCIMFAVLNFIDFLNARKENYGKIRMQLPRKLRKFNNDLVKRFSTGKRGFYALAVFFALGFIIAAGEFLCTGQIYMATIVYLIKQTSGLDPMVVSAFVLYVVAMSAPLAIIILLLRKGRELFGLSETVRRNLPTTKLITSTVFLAFAVFILLYAF